jgi:Skp family chaperone for outer membrane proteins
MKMKYWGIVSTGLALVMLLAMASLAAAAKIAVVDTAKVVKEYKAQANKPGTLKKDILNDMKEIIAEIAKSEKFELVLDKENALYGGEDITYKVFDQLMKRLKGK